MRATACEGSGLGAMVPRAVERCANTATMTCPMGAVLAAARFSTAPSCSRTCSQVTPQMAHLHEESFAQVVSVMRWPARRKRARSPTTGQNTACHRRCSAGDAAVAKGGLAAGDRASATSTVPQCTTRAQMPSPVKASATAASAQGRHQRFNELAGSPAERPGHTDRRRARARPMRRDRDHGNAGAIEEQGAKPAGRDAPSAPLTLRVDVVDSLPETGAHRMPMEVDTQPRHRMAATASSPSRCSGCSATDHPCRTARPRKFGEHLREFSTDGRVPILVLIDSNHGINQRKIGDTSAKPQPTRGRDHPPIRRAVERVRAAWTDASSTALTRKERACWWKPKP